MEKILLTRAGYEKLIRELEFLSQVERPQVVREILDAAQEGRVEKNPDFQSALVHRRQLEWERQGELARDGTTGAAARRALWRCRHGRFGSS